MDQNFQTSFIPKKSITEERVAVSHSFGFLTVIAFFIFLTMVVTAGGLYFYKGIMTKNISNMENELNLARNRFEPAKISQLQILDKRLRASSEVLSRHIAVSPIFKALQEVTMKSVRFTKFSYDLTSDINPKVGVKMGGVAVGYRSVALQADLFSKKKYFIDPIFSNLTLDEKGNVVFDLEFRVEPSFIDYQQMIAEANQNTTFPPPLDTGITN
ncbi:MAG: hypothetical protein Q8O46_03330 [bacterium]|nr:hypothetical protein [bacterium]